MSMDQNRQATGADQRTLLAAIRAGMDHAAYRALFHQVVHAHGTTGADQSEELVAYTKLNQARMHRNEKTVKLLPETLKALQDAPAMTWLVLTEAWCGDSSQVLPVIDLMAEASPRIELRILLRDEHLGLMDRYLIHGGRSIPKLIAVDPLGKELFTWGPRPTAPQEMVWANKALPPADQLPKEAIYAKVHAWYAADKGKEVQREIATLLREHNAN
ncbi:MAG: thioredoxin family protein [Flavobacteriales bacterium]